MAEALVQIVLGQLVEIAAQQLNQEVRLVTGVGDEVQKLKSSFASIHAVLSDAERREVKEEAVRIWLEKLKDISYEIGDVLDEWSTELLKIRIKHDDDETCGKMCSYSFPCPCFCFQRAAHRRDIALQIRKLNEKLGTSAREKDEFRFSLTPNVAARHQDLHHHRELTTSFINASPVFGREEEIEDVVNKLMLCPQESSSNSIVQIISIVGTGGMGKTTLAQRVYNDVNVQSHFQKMIWICVSDPFDGAKVINTTFELLGGDASKITQLQAQMKYITESMTGKKIMLVLDDVWTEDSDDFKPLLDVLQGASKGSKILVTTRKEQVARSIGSTYIHPIGKLSDVVSVGNSNSSLAPYKSDPLKLEDKVSYPKKSQVVVKKKDSNVDVSWDLFSSIAFIGKTEEDRKKMEEVGKEIVERCKGLALALKTIASHLRYKTTVHQWRAVLDSELWKLEVAKEKIFAPLMLSYYDLPSAIKRCFSYCAIFPKDLEYQPRTLIRHWMAQGYLNSSSCGEDLEAVGQDYLEQLAMRSFFQDFEWDKVDGSIKSLKMHDIVHDSAQFLAKREIKILDIGKERSPSIRSSCYSEKPRHLKILNVNKSKGITGTLDLTNLHTLILPEVARSFDTGNLFGRMRFVKVLDLSGGDITDIPKEVGKLKHLRYLDLSHNEFSRLPEEICELCNLQTMCLDRCRNLEELPKSIGKLVNLRHLLIGVNNLLLVRPFPGAVVRNTSLRTLPLIVLGGDEDANVEHREEFRGFNHEGPLTIRGLQSVRDRSDAAKAELKKRTKLIHLTLVFKYWRYSDDHDLDVAEGLEPYFALERLKIEGYNATALPSWIMLLSKLRILDLYFCSHVKELPPLGRLVSLQSLIIYYNDDLKTISEDFWGIPKPMTDYDSNSAKEEESTSATTMLTSSIPSEIAVFPKLEELCFSKLSNLEEWEGPWVDTRKITSNPKEVSCKFFPCLRKLRIYGCEKLKALPNCITTAPLLQQLDLADSPLLEARYNAHPKYFGN